MTSSSSSRLQVPAVGGQVKFESWKLAAMALDLHCQ